MADSPVVVLPAPAAHSGAPDRRWSVLGLITIASWIVVLGAWFFENYLWGFFWVLALFVFGGLAAISIALTVGWVARSLVRGRLVQVVATVAIAAAIGIVIARVPWEEVYPRVWFTLHRQAFLAAEAAVRSGGLDVASDYYGAELPAEWSAISITGRIGRSWVWSGDDEPTACDEPIEFVPAAVGIPDGGIGFVHLPCEMPPPGYAVNGFDDGIIPRIRLGDGWWWADGHESPVDP